MATTRLTDIVSAMKSKWTYGDKDFAYEFEVNQNHNTQYPYMMIIPPNSEIPEVYNGWESYDFEIDFFDLYQTASQQAVLLEQKWDNLEDLALEWLNNVMINFKNPTGAGVRVYFLEESIDIKRIKEVANDRLIQVKMSFTMRGVTRCMFGSIPTNYPTQVANLSTWLRADSGVTFDTPTKKVSAWADQSGNNNNVAQSTTTKQPLRIPYDGASDKTRINFDGTADNFISDSNSPITTDVTMFTVAQSAAVTPAFTNTYSTHFELGSEVCEVGNPAGGAGGQLFSFTDGAGNDQPFSLSIWANIDPTNPWRGWIEKNELGQQEYSFYPEYSTGNVLFRISDNTNGGSIGVRVQTIFPKGEWVHVACTYDGGGGIGGMNIYFDGVLQTSTNASAGVYTAMRLTTSKLEIGTSNINAYYGDVDEASIFDSELSQADVAELYNLGNPSDVATSTPNANLIGWWRMGDGATFPTIPDESTNSNDGTLLSMVASDIRANAPNSEAATYFSYESGNVRICLGSSSERLYCHIADSVAAAGEWNARYIWDGDTSEYHIATMQLDSSTANLKLQYNNGTSMEGVMANYDPTQTYNSAKFKIGNGTHLGNLDGNVQELIIYNRVLNTNEINTVRDYLNEKYKIY
jgi:hypothetical protein